MKYVLGLVFVREFIVKKKKSQFDGTKKYTFCRHYPKTSINTVQAFKSLVRSVLLCFNSVRTINNMDDGGYKIAKRKYSSKFLHCRSTLVYSLSPRFYPSPRSVV